jgi:hypothetical protein
MKREELIAHLFTELSQLRARNNPTRSIGTALLAPEGSPEAGAAVPRQAWAELVLVALQQMVEVGVSAGQSRADSTDTSVFMLTHIFRRAQTRHELHDNINTQETKCHS